MLAILLIVLPVFLVIGAGYLAVRGGVFPESGVSALLTFSVRVAVPCLLFSKMIDLPLGKAFDAGMLVSFYTGAFVCFAIAFFAGLKFGKTPGEAVAFGFAAYFSNTVLVGLPVMERAYGQAEIEAMFAVIAMHAPLLYAFGMIAMEAQHAQGRGAIYAAKRAARSILSNALMIGIALGLTLNLLGLPLPEPLRQAVDLIVRAALPTALFGLGAALTRYRLEADLGWAVGIALLGLILHPGVAYLLGSAVFALEESHLRAAALTAAMPAGLNVYVFASMYRRAEPVAASVVVLSTALSVLTISIWLAILGGAGQAAG